MSNASRASTFRSITSRSSPLATPRKSATSWQSSGPSRSGTPKAARPADRRTFQAQLGAFHCGVFDAPIDETRFATSATVPPGVLGRRGRRNAPSLLNRGYGHIFFWDGRSASLEEQVLKPIEDPNETGMTVAEAVGRVGVPE